MYCGCRHFSFFLLRIPDAGLPSVPSNRSHGISMLVSRGFDLGSRPMHRCSSLAHDLPEDFAGRRFRVLEGPSIKARHSTDYRQVLMQRALMATEEDQVSQSRGFQWPVQALRAMNRSSSSICAP